MNIFEAQRILGLFGRYDEELMKKQYRLMTKKYHPDNCELNGISKCVAEQKIREINQAYELLNNVLKSSLKTSFNNRAKNSYTNQRDEVDKIYKLRNIVLDKVGNIIKLNKQNFSSFEEFFKKYDAYTILERYKILMWDLKFYFNRFELGKWGSLRELEAAYQNCINEYKEGLVEIYDEFYNVYLYEHMINKLDKKNLYLWLLDNRDKNRDFSLVSQLVWQLDRDIDKVIPEIVNNLYSKYFDKVSRIYLVFYSKFRFELNGIINSVRDDTIKEIKELINIRITNFYNFSFDDNNNLCSDLDRIIEDFSNRLHFLDGRVDRIQKIEKLVLNKNKMKKCEVFLNDLRKEYNEEKFNKIETLIFSELDNNIINKLVNKIRDNVVLKNDYITNIVKENFIDDLYDCSKNDKVVKKKMKKL